MENKYYFAYVYDVLENLTDGFQERKTTRVIVLKENDDYKEIFTKGKVLVGNGHTTFDGHKAFEENFRLYGKIGENLSQDEVTEILNNLGPKGIKKYLTTVIHLINKTEMLALQGEKEYLQTLLSFVNQFDSGYENIYNNHSNKKNNL